MSLKATNINIENINRLIDVVRADAGRHLLMSSWCRLINPEQDAPVPEKYEPCQTAFCMAGHINHIILTDKGVDLTDRGNFDRLQIGEQSGKEFRAYHHEMGDELRAAQWLGLKAGWDKEHGREEKDTEFAHVLFYLARAQMSRERFDELPELTRANIIVELLTHIRDTLVIDWDRAINKVLEQA